MPIFFDDFTVGREFLSPGRTITEADVVAFAGLTGDFNQIHTDVEFAAATRFGQRLVHGVLGLSICTGLVARTGIFEGSAIALLGIENWTFHLPIFIGDTVHVRLTVKDARLISRGDAGVVVRGLEIINQRDEIVQSGVMPILIGRSADAIAADVRPLAPTQEGPWPSSPSRP